MERDNPHPLWRQERCELCKAGDFTDNENRHYRHYVSTIGYYFTGACTAPSADAVIAALTQQVATLDEQATRKRFEYAHECAALSGLVEDQAQQIAELQKERDRAAGEMLDRVRLIAAMSQTAKEQGE